MAIPTIILCEERGWWAAAFRRALGAVGTRLRETRRLVDCEAELTVHPDALVALEWNSPRRAELANFVDAVSRRFSQAAVIALAERAAAADEALAREAGAIHFVSSPRNLHGVIAAVRRRNAAPESTLPPLGDTLAELLATYEITL